MFKLKIDELTDLDPEQANKYLEKYNGFGGQRSINQNRVEELTNKIKNNQFHGSDIAFGVFGKERYLVNGQHTCSAIIKSNRKVKIRLKEFNCDTAADLSKLFAQFDNGGIRSIGQMAKAYKYANSELLNTFSDRCISTCSAALSYLEAGNQYYAKLSKDERLDLVLKNQKECNFINNLVFLSGGKDKHKHLTRARVFVVIIKTYRIDVIKALKFWEGVRDGVGLVGNAPQYKLREWLKSISNAHNVGKGKKITAEHEMENRCNYAWNWFYTNKTGNFILKQSDKLYGECNFK